LAGAAVVAGTGCSVNVDLGLRADGSGVSETTSFDLAEFDEIHIGSAFNAEITVVDGPQSVEVTLDDNLFVYLIAEVEGDRLTVKMDRGNIDYEVDPTVVITVSELTELHVSGASDVDASGVAGDRLGLEVSGASEVAVEADVAELTIDSSGASNVDIEGAADTVDIEASGASSVNLAGIEMTTAAVDVSGASNVGLDGAERVTGEASGASTIVVGDDAAVSVSTSGASSVERR
jgi:hypothetical protein